MGLEAPKTKNTAALARPLRSAGLRLYFYALVTVCLFCFLLPFGYWQMTYLIDFLGNFRSTVLLVSFAPGFVSLPCITPSSAALETLFTAQNILRNTALLRFPRKSDLHLLMKQQFV